MDATAYYKPLLKFIGSWNFTTEVETLIKYRGSIILLVPLEIDKSLIIFE